jgi:hypothetical protein
MDNLITKQTMSSLEIAEIADRDHKNVLAAIRTMEPAWLKVTGLKFQPSEYTDATGRKLPMYELTQRECLYVATKFNDVRTGRDKLSGIQKMLGSVNECGLRRFQPHFLFSYTPEILGQPRNDIIT